MADSITIQEQQWPANSPEGTPSSTHQHHYVPPASPMRLAALRRASSRKPTIAEPRTKTMTTQSSTSNAENDQLATILSRAPGAEPGIDARKASAQRAYSHIHEDCEIEVIDYSSENIKFRQFHNDSFLEFLESNESVRRTDTKVRWINIGGISWDIMSALALKYQLHPLSVEDVFHSGHNSISKADYYRNHLFLHILAISTCSKKASPLHPKYLRGDPIASDSSSSEEEEEIDVQQEEEDVVTTTRSPVMRRRRKPAPESVKPKAPLRWMESAILLSPESRKRQERIAKLNALKKRDRVRVVIGNVFIFLFKDGTVISIHSRDRSFGNQIYQRLVHSDTVLRKDPDPSLLVHAIVDLTVDQALLVVDKYSDKIAEIETNILLKPRMDAVRGLHIISADLTTRKRNMQPMKRLVYGLRKFDVERTIAALDSSPSTGTTGYMSPKAKVYLADVADHLETVLSSLNQYSTMVDNLVDFAFNMSANSINKAMWRMTVVSAVFLPLSFWCGYCGMNFARFGLVQKHADLIYWEIALPVLAVILPLAFWEDIVKVSKYIGKMKLISRAERSHSTRVQWAKKQLRHLTSNKKEE